MQLRARARGLDPFADPLPKARGERRAPARRRGVVFQGDQGRRAERLDEGRSRLVEDEVLAGAEHRVARIAMLRDPGRAFHDAQPAAKRVFYGERAVELDAGESVSVAEVHGLSP